MRQSLLKKPPQQPKSVINPRGKGFTLFVTILVLILVSIAFYLALDHYLKDSTLPGSPFLRCAIENVIRAGGIQNAIAQDKASLDNQTEICEETRVKIEENQFEAPFINVYKEINATIVAFNETCNAQIASMTTTLMQLINGTNATADVIGNGICQFNTLYPNQTTLATTAVEYKRLTLNGLEFYYYVFGASTEEIRVDDAGARIENCSPVIFNGMQSVKPLYVDGGSLTPSTYVQGITMGENMLELLPNPGPFVNQTLKIEEGFQVWLNLF